MTEQQKRIAEEVVNIALLSDITSEEWIEVLEVVLKVTKRTFEEMVAVKGKK